MTAHTAQAPADTTDAYNFKVHSWGEPSTVNMYVITNNQATYESNDLNLANTEYVGFTTRDTAIGKGYLVDNSMIVESVSECLNGMYLYMKALSNGY